MQDNAQFSWKNYEKTPIIGIIRGFDSEIVKPLAQAYINAGFYTLEVTMNTKGVTRMIEDLRSSFPDLNIGAGTVCTLRDFDKAIASGAQFIVTPILNEEVIKKAVKAKIPIFPGAYTPTEIYKAWSLGASAVKIFPATQLGPKFIKEVMAPLDMVKVVPTGGVSHANIKSFFEFGAFGVGMGSSLFDKDLITQRNFEGLEQHFKSLKDEIRQFCVP
ncbi:bifunctional 4-hydroxy-2-oxoglutarate aldolase/2-dehydro-3-deoxy-phosphogluconate aldolase [Pareuzebyella sediminis]|uniref:bifunctional 4-hydroxy-2-oxoglutarate aldolase/2-dehydro-3-deoxy-phosphogluconate aldolase n=1 Tax=Pareuzebyella sediminis TaxID=2607998 RepID=UPI0011ECBEA2|nr:bifunctional 4-hydroxy-2-oxoglutarate aldolase/2-dehydro-3-deoxy-phosphogluconate aldolase [Pareuzebyella sediminis]